MDKKESDGGLGEELELISNCTSALHSNTIHKIDLYLWMSSWKLTSSANQHRPNGSAVRDTIVLNDNLDQLCSDQEVPSKVRAVARRLWSIFIGYIIIKYIIITVLRYEHDILIKKVSISSANLTSSLKLQDDLVCLLAQQIHLSQPDEVIKRLDRYQQWMDLLGDPAPSVRGWPQMIYAFTFAAPIILYLFSVYSVSNNSLQLDLLGTIYNPLGERKRTKHKLGIVVDDIINFLLHHEHLASLLAEHRMLAHAGIELNDESSNELRESKLMVAENQRLISLILTVFHSNLVRPCILTGSWHRKLMRATNFLLGNISNSVCLFAVISISIMILGEIYLQMLHRFQMLECWRWKPEAVVASEGYWLLQSLKPSYWTRVGLREAHQNNDQSLGSIFESLKVVMAQYITLNRLATISELCTINALICGSYWSPLGLWIFHLAIVDRLVWLQQINHQLECCLDKLYATKRKWIVAKNIRERVRDDEDEVMKLLLITYLNYRLFKDGYRKFKLSMNFFMLQHCMVLMFLLLNCFLAIMNLDIHYWTPVLLAIGIFSLALNGPGLLATQLVARLDKLMRLIDKLMTFSTMGSRRFRTVMELWRTQLLDKTDLRQTYSFTIAGLFLNAKTMIAFNSYLLALWILLIIKLI